MMTNTEPPVVYVVDDDRSVCAAVKRLLWSAGHHVRAFTNTRHVFARGRPDGPCCLVLDLQLLDDNGLHFQEVLANGGIRVPIIFLTGQGDIPTCATAMKAGAEDFFTKPFDASRFLGAIERALDSDSKTLAEERSLTQARGRYESLTPREREIFAAVTSGLLNKQVAADLAVAEKTVKVHRGRVMEKMHAVAFADLVRMADQLGIRYEPATSAPAGW